MFSLAEHSCGDCKLRCIDCNAQICPKCLVECPVGNRCKNCAGRFTSHVLQIDFWALLRSFCAAFVAGLLFAGLQIIFPLGGFYMLFLVYFLGSFTGNIIFKIAGRKMGTKIATTVAVGILAGNLCTSFASQCLYDIALQRMTTNNIIADSTSQSATDTDFSQRRELPPSGDNNNLIGTRSTDISQAIDLTQARRRLAPSLISLSLIIFMLGTISSFLGWGNPFAGLFRR